MKKILFLLSTLFLINSYAETTGFPDEYYEMRATTKKQDYFFDYLYPYIEHANKKILKNREFILKMRLDKHFARRSENVKRLTLIAKRYRVDSIYDYKKLLLRVNIVPPSLALAQAAVESGWGTSRFVREGNNLFGHWTYGKNGEKGMVPLNRDANATHMVRIFESFEKSISSYMLNLNRTNAYTSFRMLRSHFQKMEKDLSGLVLSQTLINYSQIKERYLRILKIVIQSNNLKRYDEKFYKNLKKEKNEIWDSLKI
ncbi:glucosaminidase domain-containing protein [Arcobacter sp. F2176]|uniref:glucosaminidase domain-containing protein n=1 Tax=Arcobacter sp. F2176 TaxID=2044511 RepID=UPI00100ADF90|nr:glucosaminidase domain-containing protein [Arcobacter sp. F2176]RXJ79618.1 mannosyl-glycoprotein endo-beta-N-acetylglucosamidase [Arcobacter sp. F2176]